jgi:tetratricopeptide (TPR) repeat protein
MSKTSRHAAALAALEQGLKHPTGADTERHEVLTWLVGHHLKKPGEPIEIWREGHLRRSNPTRIEIHNEPPLRVFPPEWNAVALQTTQEIDRRNWQEALEHAQRWQRMDPQHSSPLVHLAAIKAALHHPDTEVIHLYRQAYDLSPDDPFARCALAMHLAEHGQPEEARTLLDGWVNQPQQMHHTEYRSFMHAQRALAVADNKPKAVQAIDAALAKLNHQFSG